MNPRLIRALLRCYPASVRERYGVEVAELLESSPKPWRDLADVVRCGLADRFGRSLWMILLLLPPALVVGMFERPDLIALLMPTLLGSLFVLAGLWLGNRHRGPWYQHPLAALLVLSLILGAGHGDLWIRLAAYLCWVGGAVALATWVRTLRRKGTRLRSIGAALFGALALAYGLIIGELQWLAWFHEVDLPGNVLVWGWQALLAGGIPDHDMGMNPAFVSVPLFFLAPPLAFALTFAYVSGGKHITKSAEVGLTLT